MELEKFIVGQAAAIFENDKILILRYADSKKWGFPGGRIDRGEADSCPEAFGREIKEELKIEDFEIQGISYFGAFSYGENPKKNMAVAVRIIKTKNIDKIKLSPEHNKLVWIDESEIELYDFDWPVAKEAIKESFKLKKLLEK
jgi:8-oxo-dGTP pyrophosphatase MutT (NUDIX family)